jgi:hypothetical protein
MSECMSSSGAKCLSLTTFVRFSRLLGLQITMTLRTFDNGQIQN